MKAAAVLIAVFAAGNAAHAAAPALKPFTATYEVSYRGMHAGALIFRLERDATSARYTYETHANPGLLARLVVSPAAVERSVFEVDAGGVRPLEWRLDDGKSGELADGALHFDWSRGAVTGRIRGKDVRLPTQPNVQDRLSIQMAVTTALLRGQEPGALSLIDDHQIKRYTYTRKGEAKIESRLGPVDTLIYESTREGSSRLSRFWLAPRFDYAAVRAEQIRKGKVETVMELVRWERTGD
ncbi:MAG TPA: DUF3108 domain-containing protein [Steroidobacter sp.]|nr:DUF3108 domain-containing protein [Steroidobacter sp.]